jgi:hypothetical protein
MGKNQQALALAFKKCRGKLSKIKEYGITPDMKEKDIDALIERLAEAKAEGNETITVEEAVTGQRWYVEGLVRFSGLADQEQLDQEYEDSFADTASEAEMLRAIADMKAA